MDTFLRLAISIIAASIFFRLLITLLKPASPALRRLFLKVRQKHNG